MARSENKEKSGDHMKRENRGRGQGRKKGIRSWEKKKTIFFLSIRTVSRSHGTILIRNMVHAQLQDGRGKPTDPVRGKQADITRERPQNNKQIKRSAKDDKFEEGWDSPKYISIFIF